MGKLPSCTRDTWFAEITGMLRPIDLPGQRTRETSRVRPDHPSARKESQHQRYQRLTPGSTNRLCKLGELAASVIHEVNQPLAAIRMNGETALRWLDREEPDVARARKSIGRMLEDANRAIDIVSLVRALAAGYLPNLTRLLLEDVVGDALAQLKHELCSRNVTVDFDTHQSRSEIRGNRLQLQQLIVNLVTNAAQAIANDCKEVRKIVIRTDTLGHDHVCCMIEDSGHGIDSLHLPHLFESMFTTKQGGMGMGLLISKSIIEAHGGSIRAENGSTLGGARFTFSLPLLAHSEPS
jgi:C4-dicarboxylate-specific signal transduction histidine kinase